MFLTNKIIAISSVITTCPDFSFHVTVYYTFPCTYKQINFSLFNASCPEDCDFYLAVFILTSGKHVHTCIWRVLTIFAEITIFLV